MATAGEVSHTCSIRSCTKPSVGLGPRSRVHLCQEHLKNDKKKALQEIETVREKLQQKLNESVRLKDAQEFQGSIVGDIQELQSIFDEAHEVIRSLETRMETSLNKTKESIQEYVQHQSELEQYKKDLEGSGGDLERRLEVANQADLILDSTPESVRHLGGMDEFRKIVKEKIPKSSRLKDANEDFEWRKDIDATVGCLSVIIDEAKRFHSIASQVDCSSESEVLSDNFEDDDDLRSAGMVNSNRKAFEYSMTISDLNAEPTWLAACTKTQGFVGGKSGRIIKKKHLKHDDETVDLPQTVVFVAFYIRDNKDHLLVTSVDGQVRLRYHSDQVDWKTRITGIHCDSNRQLLFVAQSQAVVVTHLCGSAYRLINAETIQHPIELLNGIDGDADKFFVFDLRAKKILCISKESGELETDISVDIHGGGDRCCSIALLGNRILLTDPENSKVHSVSRISKRVFVSYPNRFTDFSRFNFPICVAASSKDNLVVVSNNRNHHVDVLFSGGHNWQALGTPGDVGSDCEHFNMPWGLLVIQEDERTLLVASDTHNKRLQVFSL